MFSDSFKPVPGFPGYEVNDEGVVRGAHGNRLTPRVNAGGRLYVRLQAGDERRTQQVHRLVMLAHRPAEYREDMFVAHADGDPANNRASNLVVTGRRGKRPREADPEHEPSRQSEGFEPIPSLPGYEIDESGAVWSRRCGCGRAVAAHVNAEGYAVVSLVVDGEKRNVRVHRAVMMTHRPREYREELTVDHIDKDRLNNHVSNLRMATRKEQTANRTSSGTAKNGVPVARVGREAYGSVTEASRRTGVPRAKISAAARVHGPRDGLRDWEYVRREDPAIAGERWRSVRDAGVAVGGERDVLVSNKARVLWVAGGVPRPARSVEDLSESMGYPIVHVAGKRHKLHRLVAKLFVLRDDDDGDVVNHKDGDKKNATADNLQWVTQQENVLHWHALRRRKAALDSLFLYTV